MLVLVLLLEFGDLLICVMAAFEFFIFMAVLL